MSASTDFAIGEGRPHGVKPWLNISAVTALFGLTVRRLSRPGRLLGLSVLFLVPALVAVLIRTRGAREDTGTMEAVLLFLFVPAAAVPFTALNFASGLVQDEVEEQTLTYLLVRPLPRALVYGTKLAASIVVTVGLAAVCTTINEAVLFNEGGPPSQTLPARIMGLVGWYALGLVAYNAIFGLVGLIFRKALPLGVLYIIFFEGFLASFPFVFRQYTVAYYLRCAAYSWFGEEGQRVTEVMRQSWNLPSDLPTPTTCVITLLAASAAFFVATALLFTWREMRVKTPETT